MNVNFTIDWKFVAALGATTVGIIFAVKMNPSAVEQVATHAVDTCKNLSLVGSNKR